jgi:hypothetical protein
MSSSPAVIEARNSSMPSAQASRSYWFSWNCVPGEMATATIMRRGVARGSSAPDLLSES